MVLWVIICESFLLYAMYSAVLISYLVERQPTLPFHDLETFALDGSYKLAVTKNGFHYDILMNEYEANDQTGEALKQLLSKDLPDSKEAAFAQVQLHQFV